MLPHMAYYPLIVIVRHLSVKELKTELGQKFEEYKSSLIELAIPFNNNKVADYLVFDEQKHQKFHSPKKTNSIVIMYLRMFNGENKTADIVKKAAHMQIELSKTIQKLLKEGVLVELEKS